jgi:hypothetical protein
LAVLSIRAGVASLGKSRKSDFVPWRKRSNTPNTSEVSADVTFLPKLSHKEIYFLKKWLLGWA